MLGARIDADALAERYRRFGAVEVGAAAPAWAALACGIADDPEALAFLATLPPEKRQPNLTMAAVRLVLGTVPDAAAFRALTRDPRLRAEILARRTQTNEPGRCAALLPWLAALPQPLALLEVGASSGLCLLPDRYAYDFGGGRMGPADSPCFPCRLDGIAAPAQLPRVAWRGGLDLHPLDPRDADTRGWLQALVWPGQEARAARLAQALEIAAAAPPEVRAGDLAGDALAALAAEARAAAPGATLVIFHSAVLAYLPSVEARRAAGARIAALADVWIAAEGRAVLPWIAGDLAHPSDFLVAQDGVPVGWADPHGAAARALTPR